MNDETPVLLGNAELVFADRELDWSVRSFAVREGISRLFEVQVIIGIEQADLDMEYLVGRAAAFRLATGYPDKPFRIWSGVCSEMEQLSDGDGGLSLYQVRLVPQLWRMSQRVGRRIFQHVDAIDVASKLLDEWDIKPLARLDRPLPRHAYRVQHGESDFAFLSRQLEAAGISYFFEQVDARGDGEQAGMVLVLTTAPDKAPAREQAVAYIGSTEQVDERPWVRDVRMARALRHGRVTLRGYDFRSSPELRLVAESRAAPEAEQRYELYRYDPGAFVAESAAAEGVGASRVQDGLGDAASELELERVRSSSRALCFRSNVWDLSAGSVFALEGHPRGVRAHPGVRDLRRLDRGAHVRVPRLPDVVQGKRGPARTDPGPLEDPLIGRADVEILEKLVRDLVPGIEMSQSEEIQAQRRTLDATHAPASARAVPISSIRRCALRRRRESARR